MAFYEVAWRQASVEVQTLYISAENEAEAQRIAEEMYDRDELTFDPDYLDESSNTFLVDREVDEAEALAGWVENLPNGGRS